MAQVTTGNVMSSGALDILIERSAIKNFEKNVYFYGAGEQRMLPKTYNSYKFNLIDSGATATTLTEGTVPTETSFSMNQVEVTMEQIGAFVKVSDLALSDSPVDPLVEAGWDLGRVVAEKVDTNIQTELNNSTNVLYAGDATTTDTIDASDTLAATDLAEAFARLKGAAAPTIDGGYVAVVHPFVAHDLRNSDTGTGAFLDVNKYVNNTGILNGEIGKLNGVRIVESSNVAVGTDEGATTTDVYRSYVFGEKAFAVVKSEGMNTYINGLGSAGVNDPLSQQATVGVKIRFGSKILKQDSLYVIEAASSLGANA